MLPLRAEDARRELVRRVTAPVAPAPSGRSRAKPTSRTAAKKPATRATSAARAVPARGPFLGYVVFNHGEHFPSSQSTLTGDQLYLKAYALAKLNVIPMGWANAREKHRTVIEDRFRTHPTLRLRRVYAAAR